MDRKRDAGVSESPRPPSEIAEENRNKCSTKSKTMGSVDCNPVCNDWRTYWNSVPRASTKQPVPTRNFVHVEVIELVRSWRVVCRAMIPVVFSLVLSLRSSFRKHAALQTEILALRHQLLVLQRSNRSRRLR